MKGVHSSAEKSRQAILDAATREFAVQGLAGARTDSIAKAAGVNIALLFYYFKNKEQLYLTVLEQIFAEMNRRVTTALDCCETNRDRVLAYVHELFDYVADSIWRPRMVMQEYLRGGQLSSPQSQKLIRKYVRPIHERLSEIVKDGIRKGEFRAVDVPHFLFSMGSMVTMYFTKTAIIEQLTDTDPLSPEQLRRQRKAVTDFVTAALLAAPASARHNTRRTRKVS